MEVRKLLTIQEIDKINANVNRNFFDTDKLIEYLNTHEIVGNEVFKIVDINPGNKKARLLVDLEDKYGYVPVPVKTFIRRIPFYFYSPEDDKGQIKHAWLGLLVHRIYMRDNSDELMAEALEEMYQALEDIHYRFHIKVEDIFGYMDIRGQKLKTDQFMQWHDYLNLCEKLHWYDFMPENFMYKYNMALEAAGRKPIIYDLDEMIPGEYCFRNGNTMEIEGTFPLDPAGNLVFRWIGIILKNPGNITCGKGNNRYTAVRINIELSPTTELYARNLYNSEKDVEQWYRLYAGPQIMEFDYTVLKYKRQKLKMTQKEVADAVGATLRTYQKWETGVTTPDSKYLLRLLNWLDIRDAVEATKWSEDWDSK